MKKFYIRNYVTFGVGTIGRDMVYTLISMFLTVYLTEALDLADSTLWWVTAVIVASRVFDALNDPVMGVIVDNTKSRFGKFKPWIFIGALLSGIFTVLLFTDFGLTGISFVIVFALVYVGWGITYTINDISYWSMLPSLTIEKKEREQMGAFARICASIGLYAVVVTFVNVTNMLNESHNSSTYGYFLYVLIPVLIMWIGQLVTIFGVKEPKELYKEQKPTKLKELFTIIFRNDQLLSVSIAMALFMIGYMTTTSFGVYFFKYAYKDEGMYMMFAIVLGVSQLSSFVLFPILTKFISRKKLYSIGVFLVVSGYILFFFAPMSMTVIGPAGVLIFLGQGFIQMLMLMFLTDSIEYGQWKLGKRNESVTFSLQPFIYKIGGAAASGVVLVTLILSGISSASDINDVTNEGLVMMKSSMLLFPLVLIIISYAVYMKYYKIDEKMYKKIIDDLAKRGEVHN